MYTDPDGELIWLAPVIIGAVIGGYSGYKIGKANDAKGWGMFGYILGGAAIGGVAGYTGFSVFSSAMAAGTAAGMGGISAGFNAGLLSGMASGAITGGGMAALRGGSFSDVLAGATMGAWTGAVAGGISGAIAGEMHNIETSRNFLGTQNSRNTSNLWASLDSPDIIYYGWLPEVSVYATDLRAAAAARAGMNAAGRFIFQAAMYGSMAVSTVGISSAVGAALWRMGARQAAKSGTVAFRSVGAAGKEVFNPANFKAVSQSYLKGIGIEDIHAFKAEWLGTNQGLKLFDVVKNTATNELLIIRKTTQEVVERTYIIGP